MLSPRGFDIDLEVILAQFVNANGICRTCGQNHSFEPDFEVVKTSVNNISKLFGERPLDV